MINVPSVQKTSSQNDFNKIEQLNINEELRRLTQDEEIINHNPTNLNQAHLMDSLSSIDSKSYHSAKSSIISTSQITESVLDKSNKLTDSLCSKNSNEDDKDDDDDEEDFDLNEKYKHVQELVANGEYNQIKEIEAMIIKQEMENRKKKHEDKMKKLLELEESMKTSKDNYIEEEQPDPRDPYVLACINPDEGYSIIKQSELDKHYERKEFKDYEFYIKK